jgi:hypothetical protein
MTQENDSKSAPARAPDFIAWHVPERENAPWTRVGAAWVHKDSKGYSLHLDLMPTMAARIVLRANRPKTKDGAA